MTVRGLRPLVLIVSIAAAGSACVVLDLFPGGQGGEGGGVGTGAGGAPGATAGVTDASATSTGTGGGGLTASVDWITGLETGASLASVRFLDVAANAQHVVVVGVAHGGAGAALSFGGGCMNVPLGFSGAFFVAWFDHAGTCESLTFFSDSFAPPLAASVVLPGDLAKVALSGFGSPKRSVVYDAQPTGGVSYVLDGLDGVAIADMAAYGTTLVVGGAVTATPVSPCGDIPGLVSQDEDAFLAEIGLTACQPMELQHAEGLPAAEGVSSVAVHESRRGFVGFTRHDIQAFGVPVSADVAFYQDTFGVVAPLGSFACGGSPAMPAPPRVVFGASGDWIFGPVCSVFRVGYRPDAGDFLFTEPKPAPVFFDRPVVDAAGTALVFGGEYRGDGNGPPWGSEVVTGVVGAVDSDGNVLFTLGLSGEAVDRSTEVTGVAASADGSTVWVIGNHAAPGVIFGATAHEDASPFSCVDPGSPCKPLLAKLTLTQR